MHVQRVILNLYVYEAFLECYSMGFSDACPFKTFILLVFCTFSGDVGELKQVTLIFWWCKDLRVCVDKAGRRRFVSPVHGSSVTCNFFVEKSDGF